jgi:hypothetical protein
MPVSRPVTYDYRFPSREIVPQRLQGKSKSKVFLTIVLIALLFNSVVFPNSFQIVNAALMIFFVVVIPFRIHISIDYRSIALIFASFAVTITYIFVGMANNAPDVALLQVVIIYMISPVLWIVISFWVLKEFKQSTIFQLLAWLTICSCLTVAIYFYLVQNFGPVAVKVFNTAGNIEVNENYSAATMHVFGSLIFLGAGFYSAPSLILNPLLRYSVLISLALTAIASGRSAFILSLAIGVMIFTFTDRSGRLLLKIITGVIAITICLVIATWTMNAFLGVDVFAILQGHYEKISLGGGDERLLQNESLLNGINENSFLGSGHGVGVAHIRSDEMPWRYEAVLLATLFRVGIFGSLVYAIPFIMALFVFAKQFVLGRISDADRFFGGGLLAALISANTNPYIEGFTFQWMYFLPIVYFLSRQNFIGKARR